MTNERLLPGLRDAGLKGFADYGTEHLAMLDLNWRILSLVCGGAVESMSTVLPGSGSLGDVYIVPSDAASNANKLALWDGASGAEDWVFFDPLPGWHFRVKDDDIVAQWNGSVWDIHYLSGLADAPMDGLQYIRKNADWEPPVSSAALPWVPLGYVNGSSIGAGPHAFNFAGYTDFLLVADPLWYSGTQGFVDLYLSTDNGATSAGGTYHIISDEVAGSTLSRWQWAVSAAEGQYGFVKFLHAGLPHPTVIEHVINSSTVNGQSRAGWMNTNLAYNGIRLQVNINAMNAGVIRFFGRGPL